MRTAGSATTIPFSSKIDTEEAMTVRRERWWTDASWERWWTYAFWGMGCLAGIMLLPPPDTWR